MILFTMDEAEDQFFLSRAASISRRGAKANSYQAQSDSAIVTGEELAKLPKRHLVAFVARCARRVQRFYEDCSDYRKKGVQAVEPAIQFAESYAENTELARSLDAFSVENAAESAFRAIDSANDDAVKADALKAAAFDAAKAYDLAKSNSAIVANDPSRSSGYNLTSGVEDATFYAIEPYAAKDAANAFAAAAPAHARAIVTGMVFGSHEIVDNALKAAQATKADSYAKAAAFAGTLRTWADLDGSGGQAATFHANKSRWHNTEYGPDGRGAKSVASGEILIGAYQRAWRFSYQSLEDLAFAAAKTAYRASLISHRTRTTPARNAAELAFVAASCARDTNNPDPGFVAKCVNSSAQDIIDILNFTEVRDLIRSDYESLAGQPWKILKHRTKGKPTKPSVFGPLWPKCQPAWRAKLERDGHLAGFAQVLSALLDRDQDYPERVFVHALINTTPLKHPLVEEATHFFEMVTQRKFEWFEWKNFCRIMDAEIRELSLKLSDSNRQILEGFGNRHFCNAHTDLGPEWFRQPSD